METKENQVPQDIEKLKAIPKWARRYAGSRTVPMIASLFVAITSLTVVCFTVYYFLQDKDFWGAIMMTAYIGGLISFLLLDRIFSTYFYRKNGLTRCKGIIQFRNFIVVTVIPTTLMCMALSLYNVTPRSLALPILSLIIISQRKSSKVKLILIS